MLADYLETLRFFNEECGGSGIVFGGCLRDTICGKGPIKDFDIAVNYDAASQLAVQTFAIAKGAISRSTWIGYGTYPDIVCSTQVTIKGDEPTVNFVFLSMPVPFTMKNVASRCDFGICQVAHDGNTMFATPEFFRDLWNKTFTYTRDPDEAQVARSLRRWERFKGRYPDYTLVLPEEQKKEAA